MTIYKHDCETCRYLGTETLHEQPADVYYCEIEEPFPTIVVRTGDEPHQYSSCDVKTLFDIAQNPHTQTMELMVKFLKQLTIEQVGILPKVTH